MRVVIEGWGRKLMDLELLVPLHTSSPAAPASPPPPPAYDTHSTTAAHITQADDGVHHPFGFAPVIKARDGG